MGPGLGNKVGAVLTQNLALRFLSMWSLLYGRMRCLGVERKYSTAVHLAIIKCQFIFTSLYMVFTSLIYIALTKWEIHICRTMQQMCKHVYNVWFFSDVTTEHHQIAFLSILMNRVERVANIYLTR